ncbi:DUF5719 family protein [Nocardiopsis sp. ATB16-24]|uniref:DUF5719 family protein n=1 Tax=Nocardiopsis sp. ATB16-24 TaxID=3019555 RepID=UPI00255320F7|nr:DUF5719 family protein [Nocardiopsis sp. ATB16-24]
MRLIVENRFALFGLVGLALAALFGVAFVVRPVTAELGVTEPDTVRPDHAVRVCPAPHGPGEATVAAFAPRVGRDDEGRLWAETVPAAPEDGEEERAEAGVPVGEEPTEPGRVWRADTAEAADPLVIRAQGSLASGLDAAQITLSDDSATEVRCAEPSIGTWFALPGGDDEDGGGLDSLTVHLTNPEESRATVSVDVYTEGGPSYSPESRGISLPAGESTVLELTALVQSTGAVGVHVRTSTGRVAASLLAEHDSGSGDWVPPTAAPAKEHVIPGVPGGDGRRRLLVAAPGDDPVEVRVHTVSSASEDGEETEEPAQEDGRGTGTAEDPTVLNVPPAASAWLTLESVLGGEAGTVVVESDAPVVAGVAVEAVDGEGEVVETAYTSAVPPLRFPLDTTAILPDVPEGADTHVLLGAVGADVTLVATPIGVDGTQGDAVRVEVPAGTTMAFGAGEEGWRAPSGTDSQGGHTVRLELLEGSAPVYVARVLRDGEALSVLPVRPAPVRIALPVVRDSMVGVVP